MIIYLFVAIFPLLVGTFYNTKIIPNATEEMLQTKKHQQNRWWWLFIAALPMFALIAFRAPSIGADTGGYLKYFNQMVNTSWVDIFEVNSRRYEFEEGFVIFEKLITCITDSAEVYQVIYSSVYLCAVVTFANWLDKHNFSFLFFFATLGVYMFMFTGVRQCLAMSICLLSYKFIKERKLIPFLIMLLLAFLFHKSAILFLAAYLIYNRKINWQNGLIYTVICALSFLFIDNIQQWFNNALDYEYEVEQTGNGFIFFAVVFLITAFSYITILYYKKSTHESNGLMNIGVITLCLWFVRLATRVAERPSFYFMFFTAAMLCYGLDAPKNVDDKKIFKIFVYGACLALYVYKFLTSYASVIPYKTFF